MHSVNFAARPDDYSPIIRSSIERGIPVTAVGYLEADHIRRQFRLDMANAMKGFDVFLSPSTPTPAPKGLTTTGDSMFQAPWTAAGFPTITLPSGLSTSGLPLGIQLASSHFEERSLITAAHWCEQVLEFSMTPPVLA